MSALPEIQFENLFRVDPVGQKLWRYYLGDQTFKEFLPRYEQMGRNAALATPLSRIADRETPRLVVDKGVEKVEYNPAYVELQQLSYGAGIVGLKYSSDFLKKHSAQRHMIAFSIGYYFAQTETGLFCPICMTDALGRVMEKINLPIAQETLKHISSTSLQDLWQGAMFLTEKQGGSDVGANRVEAHEKNGRWFLRGEKWFCSNADAEASLVLARLPGESAGTRGLGLFLLLRNTPSGNFKNWHNKRLKDKLGVRSMASAEIDFNDAEAFLLGGAGEGFKIMTEMVNMSRLYNSVASMAIARRAVLEASEFGKSREAFGKKLKDLTLWRSSLADLSAEVFAMQVFVFETIRQLDLFDQGNAEAGKLVRLMTPLAKALSGKLAVFAARESMELIGGNAYIEDHIMPRLLRDALVLPIWEGTTHIQALDLLRVLNKEGADIVIVRLEQAFAKSGNENLGLVIKEKIQELKISLQALTVLRGEEAERLALGLLLKFGRVLSCALLLELTTDSSLKSMAETSLSRILERHDPFQSLGVGGSREGEEILLQI